MCSASVLPGLPGDDAASAPETVDLLYKFKSLMSYNTLGAAEGGLLSRRAGR